MWKKGLHNGGTGFPPLLTCIICRVRTRLENPWKALNFESTFSRPWKSLLFIPGPWKALNFFWPTFFIFENFCENNQPFKSCHTHSTSCGVENGTGFPPVLTCIICRVRTHLENPWKALNFESTFSRPWKSLLFIPGPWKALNFFWPAFFIFENFCENNQPFKSCHTHSTSCGVENGYQCLCIIFTHVRYGKWERIVNSDYFHA